MTDNAEKMKAVEQYLGKRIDRVIGTLNHHHVNSLSLKELHQVFDNLFTRYLEISSRVEKYEPEKNDFETTSNIGDGLAVKGKLMNLGSIKTLLSNIAALENTAIMVGEIKPKDISEHVEKANKAVYDAMYHLEEPLMGFHTEGNVIMLHPIVFRAEPDPNGE